MESSFRKIFPKRSRKLKDTETQTGCFTAEEKQLIKKAIEEGQFGLNQEGTNRITWGDLDTKYQLLQKDIQKLSSENESSKNSFEKQKELVDDIKLKETDLASMECELNKELSKVLQERESLLDAFKTYEADVEKAKEQLKHAQQIRRIIMVENIGRMRASLINKQEVMSAIGDVHDRIIQALNNLLQRENLSEDNAAKIRRTMNYFTYINMKNCLVPQVISLELDARDLELEQELLLNLRDSLCKRIEKMKSSNNLTNEVPLKSSSSSQNLLGTALYQYLSKNREENRRNKLPAKTTASDYVLSQRDSDSKLPQRGSSFCCSNDGGNLKNTDESSNYFKSLLVTHSSFGSSSPKKCSDVASEDDTSILVHLLGSP